MSHLTRQGILWGLYILLLSRKCSGVTEILANIVRDSVMSSISCPPSENESVTLREAWECCLNLSSSVDRCDVRLLSNSVYEIIPDAGELILNSGANIRLLGEGSTIISNITSSAASFQPIPPTSSRFIGFEVESKANVSTNLWLEDLNIRGFGNSTIDGGCLYLHGACNITLTEVSFTLCIARNGGALFLAGGEVDFVEQQQGSLRPQFHLTMQKCQFTECHAESDGGALSINEYTTGAYIENAIFSKCTAYSSGGAINIGEYNSGIMMTGCEFSKCRAEAAGGAVNVATNNSDIMLNAALFLNCSVGSYPRGLGGGIAFLTANRNISINDATFKGCRAGDEGGGAVVHDANTMVSLRNSSFTACAAGEYGGGVGVHYGNTDVRISKVVFDDCSASHDGSGIEFYSANRDILLSNVTFRNLPGHEPALFFNDFNEDVSIFDARFTNVYFPLLTEQVGNHNFTIERMELRNCTEGIEFENGVRDVRILDSVFSDFMVPADGGIEAWGAVHLEKENSFVTIENCLFSYCQRGIWVGRSNEYIDVVNCTFEHNQVNSESPSGGAIVIYRGNRFVTIAGSTFINNTAFESGGALHVVSGNENIALIDGESYRMRVTVESQHPYASVGAVVDGTRNNILVKAVHLPEAVGYIINFDPDTELFQEDMIRISSCSHNDSDSNSDSDSNNSTAASLACGVGGSSVIVAYEETGNELEDGYIPGILLPSLFVDGDTLVLELLGPSSDEATVLDSSQGFYGFIAHIYPVFTAPASPNRFVGNVAAEKGGAIFLLLDNPFALFINANIVGNSAGSGGGGVYIRSNNAGIAMRQVNISDNWSGSDGGGMVLFIGQYGMQLQDCSISLNRAQSGRGGGMFVSTGNGDGIFEHNNEVAFANCALDYNVARIGGALYLEEENFLILSNVSICGNAAVGSNGGGILLESNNHIALYGGDDVGRTIMCGNTAAKAGGAIHSAANSVLLVEGSLMQRNSAGSYGGALSIQGGSDLTFAGLTILQDNSAGFAGGGIFLASSLLWDVQYLFEANSSTEDSTVSSSISGSGSVPSELRISSNNAMFGSAACLANVLGVATESSQLNQETSSFLVGAQHNLRSTRRKLYSDDFHGARYLHDLNISFNQASVGGTVFWVYDPDSMPEEPAALSSSRVKWSDNIAPYGVNYTTQAVALVGPTEYIVKEYGTNIEPALQFTLQDYYGHQIITSDLTTVHASIFTSVANDTAEGKRLMDCQGKTAFIAGQDMAGEGVPFEHGVASFAHLQLSCYPEGHLTVAFEARLGALLSDATLLSRQASSSTTPASAQQYYVSRLVSFRFRACSVGEVIEATDCVSCPLGTYSLTDKVDASTKCVDCTGETAIKTCEGQDIKLRAGYWRRHGESTTILTCPLSDASSCPGGTGTGDEACGEGYEGPRCAVCAPDYFLRSGRCYACTSTNMLSAQVLIYACIVAILMGAVAVAVFFRRVMLDKARSAAPREDINTSRQVFQGPGQGPSRRSEHSLHHHRRRGVAALEQISPAPATSGSAAHLSCDLVVVPAASAPGSASRSIPGALGVGERIDWEDNEDKDWEPTPLDLILDRVQNYFKRNAIKIRIILVTWQITTTFPSVLQVSVPTVFLELVRLLSFVNLDMASIFPIGCRTEFTFIDKLVLETLLPIGLASLILTAFCAEYIIRGWLADRAIRNLLGSMRPEIRTMHERRVRRRLIALYDVLKHRYETLFLYLTYFVLPSVSVLLFQTFVCTDVDPAHEDNSQADYFLAADMSISCSSDYYRAGVAYAAVMIFVYPVGIPLMYAIMLYRCRDEIRYRDTHKESTGTDAGSDGGGTGTPLNGTALGSNVKTDVLSCQDTDPSAAAASAAVVNAAAPSVHPSEALPPVSSPMERKAGDQEELPSSNVPIVGGQEELPSSNVPIAGGQEELPSSNVPIAGGQEELPSSNVPIAGGQEELPSSNVPIAGGQEELPSSNAPIAGGQEELPSSNVPIAGGQEELPSITPIAGTGASLVETAPAFTNAAAATATGSSAASCKDAPTASLVGASCDPYSYSGDLEDLLESGTLRDILYGDSNGYDDSDGDGDSNGGGGDGDGDGGGDGNGLHKNARSMSISSSSSSSSSSSAKSTRDSNVNLSRSSGCGDGNAARESECAISPPLRVLLNEDTKPQELRQKQQRDSGARGSVEWALADSVGAAGAVDLTGKPGSRPGSRVELRASYPEARQMSLHCLRLSLLWEAYHPSLWYWEIIEAFRRIILTAVLSICFPGTNGQSVLAVFAVCTFLKMYQIYQPYRDSEDNAIAEIGQWQLLLTFFCGLLLQASVLDSGWQYGIGLSLVLASFAVLAITLYFQVRLHLRARKVSGDD